MKFVQVEVKGNACNRTKERFNRFNRRIHRIEVLNEKINESLKGDGFFIGDSIIMFRIQTFNAEDNIWSTAWEGWIPSNEIIVLKCKQEKDNV